MKNAIKAHILLVTWYFSCFIPTSESWREVILITSMTVAWTAVGLWTVQFGFRNEPNWAPLLGIASLGSFLIFVVSPNRDISINILTVFWFVLINSFYVVISLVISKAANEEFRASGLATFIRWFFVGVNSLLLGTITLRYLIELVQEKHSIVFLQ